MAPMEAKATDDQLKLNQVKFNYGLKLHNHQIIRPPWLLFYQARISEPQRSRLKIPPNKSGHFLLFAGRCFNVAAYCSINQSNNGVLLLEAAAAEFSFSACFS